MTTTALAAQGQSTIAQADPMPASPFQSYRCGGHDLELMTSAAAFQPTLTSRLLAQAARVPEGSRVLDLGCGVGVLAIVAALSGAAHADAVDVMPEACALAQANARHNGVAERVSVFCGDLFEPVGDRKYDVIINDVSGVADEVARLSPWYPPAIPTGGRDGADHITRMLAAAPRHLRPGGVLYFATGSISNVQRTLAAAAGAFGSRVEMAEQVEVPFCQEFKDNMAVMARLQAEGLIDFLTKRSRHLWTLQVYRAWT